MWNSQVGEPLTEAEQGNAEKCFISDLEQAETTQTG